MYAPIVILLIDRPDLLNPGSIPQARVELIDDSTVVTDLGGLYKDGAEGIPTEITVGELREKLKDTEQHSKFCLHKFQRLAVEKALSQALSLIQVYHATLYNCAIYCLMHTYYRGHRVQESRT